MTEEEFEDFIDIMPHYLNTYIPLFINQDVYLISNKSFIFDNDILSAISKSKNIKFNKDNLVKLEDCVETSVS